MSAHLPLEQLRSEGRIYFTKNGKPRRKNFISSYEGTEIDNIWTDIFPLGQSQGEALGYPTQKPLALLERIIQASSNPGDVVLDPFAGCGTTVAAAQKLGRQWIGIDITHLSIALLKYRLNEMFPGIKFSTVGEPQDIASACQLALDDRYQFQYWAVALVHAMPVGGQEGSKTGKKGADRGIDGIITFLEDDNKPRRVLVQVKSGGVQVGLIRDLRGTVEREGAAMGVFITLEPPTDPMNREALAAGYYHSDLWGRDYPKIQILTIEQLLHEVNINMPPQSIGRKQAQRVKGTPEQQAALEWE